MNSVLSPGIYFDRDSSRTILKKPNPSGGGGGGGSEPDPISWSVLIPSGTAQGDLVEFPYLLNGDGFTEDFWTAIEPDGSNLKFTLPFGETLERYIIDVDRERKYFWCVVKLPEIFQNSDTEFYVEATVGETFANGSVYNGNYVAAVHMHGPKAVELTGIPTNLEVDNTIPLPAWGGEDSLISIDQSPDTGAHQGVIITATNRYTIDTTSIKRYDANWNLLNENTNALTGLSAPINHLGDGDFYNGKLYIPVEYWGGSCGDFSDCGIAVYDATTLNFESFHDTSAQGHECSGLFIEPSANRITIVNYCGPCQFHRYRLSDFSYERTDSLDTPLNYIQGIVRLGDYYYITQDNIGGSGDGDICYRVSADTFEVQGQVYHTEISGGDSNSNMEGISVLDENLFILLDGGPGDQLVHTLEFVEGKNFQGDDTFTPGAAYVITLPQGYQSGTLSVFFKPGNTQQVSIASLTAPNTDTPNDRMGIAIDDGNNLGSWDSNGSSWVYTGVNPSRVELSGAVMTFDSGGDRAISINDTNRNVISAGTIPTTRTELILGREDDTANEIYAGVYTLARLRNNVADPAWISFEDVNCRLNNQHTITKL